MAIGSTSNLGTMLPLLLVGHLLLFLTTPSPAVAQGFFSSLGGLFNIPGLGTPGQGAGGEDTAAAPSGSFQFDFTARSRLIPTAARITQCRSDLFFKPETTAQLSDFIVALRQRFGNTTVRVRATRAQSHTSSSFNCPNKGNNTRLVNVYVDTAFLNKTLDVDRENMRVTIQAGMQLVKLQRELHKLGWGLPSHSFPLFSALSVGGLFSVSAHGSNVDGQDTILNSVLAVKFVDGLGRVQTGLDPALHAGASGLFGIITEMVIQAVPATKSRLIVKRYDNDNNITEVVQQAVDESAVTPGRSLVLWWRATPSDFTLYEFQVVANTTPGESYNTQWSPLNPLFVVGIPTALATENLAPFGPDLGSCVYSSTMWQPKTKAGRTVPNWTPTVGWSWEMETSGCQYGDDGRSAILPGGKFSRPGCGEAVWTVAQYHDFEFVVPFRNWPLVVETIKRIYRNAMPLYNKGSCTRAFLIRFGRTTNRTLVSQHFNTEDDRVLYISLPGLKAKSQSNLPPKYSYIWDEWEQFMLCQLGGRPHWGKTNDRAFTHPICTVRDLYPRFDELLAAKAPYDPDGIFENDIFQRMRDRRSYDLTPNCHSTFKCYCETDAHCARGQFCMPGTTFPEYKVCKPRRLIRG